MNVCLFKVTQRWTVSENADNSATLWSTSGLQAQRAHFQGDIFKQWDFSSSYGGETAGQKTFEKSIPLRQVVQSWI